MRKIKLVAVSALLLVVVVPPPAGANTCDPKLQNVCNRIHDARCTADALLTIVKGEQPLHVLTV